MNWILALNFWSWIWILPLMFLGFPGGSNGKICLHCGRPRFSPWVGKIPWSWEWQSTPVFLPGEFQGQGSLAAYSPWSHKESSTSEWLWLHLTDILKHQCTLNNNNNSKNNIKRLSEKNNWNDNLKILAYGKLSPFTWYPLILFHYYCYLENLKPKFLLS